jgi:hypothetical protein
VVSDVPVDDEAPLVTSGSSISTGAQSFGAAHRGRVCVRVFIGVSVRACCERLCCTMSFKKVIYTRCSSRTTCDGESVVSHSFSFQKIQKNLVMLALKIKLLT